MNKFFLVTLITVTFLFSIASVIAQGDQPVEGDVSDFITFDIDPAILDFDQIPFGVNVLFPGSNVMINTFGSDTESGSVMVQAEVDDDTPDGSTFFTDLLQMKADAEDGGSFEQLPFDFEKLINTGNTLTLNTRIFGNTAAHGAGPKTGTIIYTVTATPPE